jgi:hypothetical protein
MDRHEAGTVENDESKSEQAECGKPGMGGAHERNRPAAQLRLEFDSFHVHLRRLSSPGIERNFDRRVKPPGWAEQDRLGYGSGVGVRPSQRGDPIPATRRSTP